MNGIEFSTTSSYEEITMAAPEQMRAGVEAYLNGLASKDAEGLTNLFADDAVFEDPYGSEPKVGRDAIRAHFDGATQYDMTLDLQELRIAGDAAAAFFTVAMSIGGQEYNSAPIDVFTFNDDGKIIGLRAYWGDHDYSKS